MEKREAKKVKSRSQNIGTTAIRCGCGFSTTSPAAWAEHRRTVHLVK